MKTIKIYGADGSCGPVTLLADDLDLIVVEVDGQPAAGVALSTGTVGTWDRSREPDEDWVDLCVHDWLAS